MVSPRCLRKPLPMHGRIAVFWTGALVVALLVLGGNLFVASARSAEKSDRPRVVATTDGEIDDRCSMIRFLLYADQWDIEGLVYSSSKFHWKGHRWAGTEWIEEDIGKYAQVYESLRQHAPGFPSPQQLRKKVFVGNIDNVGAMDKDTPGSDRIVDVLLDAKPGPVYLQAWGGTNTIARALWKIQHKHPDQINKVSRKAIIYIILDQDKTFREYIQPNWPELQVLGSFRQFGTIAYRWAKQMPSRQRKYFEKAWMQAHITRGHGPLCSAYPVRHFLSEGDSPAFMHQIRVGLRSLEHPAYGGWGGRFTKERPAGNVWKGARDDGDLNKPIWRWAEAFQNDWAARADWCVNSYEKANHPPRVKLGHPQDLRAAAGQRVTLSAQGTQDPDGDKLRYKWWQYREPGSYGGGISLRDAGKQTAHFTAPGNVRPGQTVHLICEVSDDGTPPLTRYRRVIVTFADKRR